MAHRPNILLITCDQLRQDALGCYGSPGVRTPHLDALAARGTRFDHHFTQSPVCQPSRATLATGRYPHSHGVKFNWYDLPDSEITIQRVLTDAGYNTWAVGKMHFEPLDQLHGFANRVFVEGKLFVGDDEYRLHLDKHGLRERYQQHARRWSDPATYGATTSPLPPEEYLDRYIGRRCLEVLDDLNRRPEPDPFFLWLSFVNPHMPYDPPPPYDTLYDPDAIPLPAGWERPAGPRLPEHRTSSAGADFAELDEAKLRRVRAHYLGTVSLVDEIVGAVLDHVPTNTMIIFTSDHGEFLGSRGMLWKGGRMLYDDLLRVPLIVSYPGVLAAGRVSSHLVEATDIAPTILQAAGVAIPPGVQGRSLWPLLRGESPPAWRHTVFAEGLDVKMLRDHHWKLIFYPGRRYGELYDLVRDPIERDNLYGLPTYRKVRDSMIHRLAEKLIKTEDPLPRPTHRPGYAESSGFHSGAELT